MKVRRAIVAILVAAVSLLSVLPVLAEPATAVTWIKSQQQTDGGFGATGSSLSETVEVVYALAAAGTDFSSVAVDGSGVVDYLTTNVSQATSVGSRAKLALALIYAGADASDLLSQIEASLSPTGMYGGADDSLTGHVYAMLAVAAAGQAVPAEAVTWLENHQAGNGGWAWNGSTDDADADTNTTATALQALAAAGGKSDAAVAAAVEYLRGVQNSDGGFPYQSPSAYGTDSDANSTAVVIQGLLAAGEDLTAWETDTGSTPLGALATFQRNDGAFAWQAAYPDANLLATAQAVPALLGKVHPLVVVATEAAAEATTEAAAEATTEAAAEATTEAVSEAEAASEATAEATTEADATSEVTVEASPAVGAAVTPTAAPALLPTTGAGTSMAPLLVLAGLGLVTAGLVMRRKLAA